MNQLVSGAEAERIVRADLDIKLSFDRSEQLNVMQ